MDPRSSPKIRTNTTSFPFPHSLLRNSQRVIANLGCKARALEVLLALDVAIDRASVEEHAEHVLTPSGEPENLKH